MKDKLILLRNEGLTYKNGKKEEEPDISSLIYITRPDKYVLLHYESKIIECKTTLKEVEGMLPNNFYRVHREYIVNLEYVAYLFREYIIMQDKTRIPISRIHRKEVEGVLKKYAVYS